MYSRERPQDVESKNDLAMTSHFKVQQNERLADGVKQVQGVSKGRVANLGKVYFNKMPLLTLQQ